MGAAHGVNAEAAHDIKAWKLPGIDQTAAQPSAEHMLPSTPAW
jgi:hypothetical protein